MATGFLAAGVHSTQITKNQVEKQRYDELDDMPATTGTALLGPDDRLRPLPRPQVRSDSDGRLLPAAVDVHHHCPQRGRPESRSRELQAGQGGVRQRACSARRGTGEVRGREAAGPARRDWAENPTTGGRPPGTRGSDPTRSRRGRSSKSQTAKSEAGAHDFRPRKTMARCWSAARTPHATPTPFVARHRSDRASRALRLEALADHRCPSTARAGPRTATLPCPTSGHRSRRWAAKARRCR